MLFLFAIGEDSILRVFEERLEGNFKIMEKLVGDIYGFPKGFLFPRIYLFYDEINVSPIPTITVQYADTVNLRIVDREIDIGYPIVRRWGFGVFWNPLNPQAIFYTISAKTFRDFEVSKLRVIKENLKNNLRVYLRILTNLDSLITLSDSMIYWGSMLIESLDSVKVLGRLEEDKVMHVKAEISRVAELREKILKSRKILKDSLESFLKMELESISLRDDFAPNCLDFPDSLRLKALYYRKVGEFLWWFPKFYLFGEVWKGNVRTPSTIAGFRVTLEFDETRRLKAKSLSSALEIEKIKLRKNKLDLDLPVLSDLSAYRNLLDISWKYYQMGAISLAEYFKVYSDYFRIRVENIRNRIRNLNEGLCEEDYEYEKGGEY